jgi:hypothetical protein
VVTDAREPAAETITALALPAPSASDAQRPEKEPTMPGNQFRRLYVRAWNTACVRLEYNAPEERLRFLRMETWCSVRFAAAVARLNVVEG